MNALSFQSRFSHIENTPWTLADLVSPPVSLFDAIDLSAIYPNNSEVQAHTDSAGVAFVNEGSSGLYPLMEYNTTPNGSPSVHISRNGSIATRSWKSSSDIAIGRWSLFTLWKRTHDGGTPGLLSYHSLHGINPYGANGSYLFAGGAFVLTRRGAKRSYKNLVSSPSDTYNTWTILSAGCEPGVGVWGKVNGVAITATDASETGGGATSTPGDSTDFNNTHSGPLYRGGASSSGIHPAGRLAFELLLDYTPSLSEQANIAGYITSRYLT